MKELAFIAVLALSHPTSHKYLEDKYDVKYKTTVHIQQKDWWIFSTASGIFTFAVPAWIEEKEFKTFEEAAVVDYYLMNPPNE